VSLHLQALYDRAVARAVTLGPDAGPRWLLTHGLLAVTDHAALPAAQRAVLAAARQRNLARNLLLIHRFQTVADVLAAAPRPIPVCPLKGLRLLATAYADDPQHRVLADLDLLLPDGCSDDAVARLAAAGWRETAASARSAGRRHERVLFDGDVTLELHTRLAAQLGPRATWQALEPAAARLYERPCHCLDEPTHLAFLCLHFVRHGPFTVLRWAEDVLRVAAQGVDGGAVLAAADRLGARRSVVAGVRALRTLVAEVSPDGALLRGLPDRLPGLAGAALSLHERCLWPALRRRPAEPLAVGEAVTPWRRTVSTLWLADRPGDAVRFLAAKLGEWTARRPAAGSTPEPGPETDRRRNVG
jgi:hypothetical protein